MTDRDDTDMRAWARRAFTDEPAAGSVGDAMGDDLARGHTGLTRRRRLMAGASGIAVAATIGALFAGGNAWQASTGGGSDVVEQPAPNPPSGRRVPMDLEPLSPSQAQEVLDLCIVEGDPSGLRVAYAWRIAVPRWVGWGLPYDAALVALDEGEGRVWTCAGGATSDNGPPTGDEPLEVLGGGGRTECPGSRYHWYDGHLAAVSDEVDRVEIRFGSDSRPGPWWVSRPHDGYLFVGHWFNLPRDTDETYRVEARAYDVDGNLIESDELAERVDAVLTPRMIARCHQPLD